MKKALRVFALIAVGVASSAAYSADRPVLKAPPPTTQVYNWSGFYVGVHGGGSWAHNNFFNAIAGEDTATFGANGYFGGAQIGYNWQAGSWIYGVELEGSLSHLEKGVTGCGFGGFGCGGGGFGGGFGTGFGGRSCGSFGGFGQGGLGGGFGGFGCGQFGARVHKLGILSGRIGYAWDRWLVYAKAGGAVAEEKVVFNLPGLFAATPVDARLGWTAGAGIEFGLATNWSFKIEYDYVDLGTERFTFTAPAALPFAFDHSQQVHLLKFGINYRFASLGSAR